MIAFHLFGRPVYRYGLFYGITFLFGYWFLGRIATQSRMQHAPRVRKLLTHHRDDLFLRCMIGVIAGGRLGHVFLYERHYYAQHLTEIIMINQGGMSFIGGVVGVTLVLASFVIKYRLKRNDMKILGDLVLCIVPVGIFLGRIGNGLNQELRGKAITDLPVQTAEIITSLGLTRIYPAVDSLIRVNTNTIQALGEGALLGLIARYLLIRRYPKQVTPGLISGVFLVGYSVVRFLVEYLKDLPSTEYRGVLSVSQWIMIGFVIVGCILIGNRRGVGSR